MGRIGGVGGGPLHAASRLAATEHCFLQFLGPAARRTSLDLIRRCLRGLKTRRPISARKTQRHPPDFGSISALVAAGQRVTSVSGSSQFHLHRPTSLEIAFFIRLLDHQTVGLDSSRRLGWLL